MRIPRSLCARLVNSAAIVPFHVLPRRHWVSMRRKPLRVGLRTLLILLVALFPFMGPIPSATYAQVSSGSVGGTVRSDTGAVIAGAEITITQVNSGSVRTLATNTDGVYYVPDIPPGRYEMKVAAPGYVTQLWTSISVAAGVPRIFNPVLQAGDPQQTVRVVAPPALVTETCTSACGNVSMPRRSARCWRSPVAPSRSIPWAHSTGGPNSRSRG